MDSCQVALLSLNTSQLFFNNMVTDSWGILSRPLFQKAPGQSWRLRRSYANVYGKLWFCNQPGCSTLVPSYLPRHVSLRVACKIFFQKLPQCISKLVLQLEHVISHHQQHSHVLSWVSCTPQPRYSDSWPLMGGGQDWGLKTPQRRFKAAVWVRTSRSREGCVQFALKWKPWSLDHFLENL